VRRPRGLKNVGRKRGGAQGLRKRKVRDLVSYDRNDKGINEPGERSNNLNLYGGVSRGRRKERGLSLPKLLAFQGQVW